MLAEGGWGQKVPLQFKGFGPKWEPFLDTAGGTRRLCARFELLGRGAGEARPVQRPVESASSVAGFQSSNRQLLSPPALLSLFCSYFRKP